MADPLSIAAGYAGLITLGIQVLESLTTYYKSYRDQDTRISRTIDRLESLLKIFILLKDTISDRRFQDSANDVVRVIHSSLGGCEEIIFELEAELAKFRKAQAVGTRERLRVIRHRIAYPLRQSTLQKLEEDIDDILATLATAVDALHLKKCQEAGRDLNDVKVLLESLSKTQLSKGIQKWLGACDVSADHNVACSKRYPGTCSWFIESLAFKSWLKAQNSFLWVNGFGGIGKSVVCSSAIEQIFDNEKTEGKDQVGLVFFYFSFNDKSKQSDLSMLRTILSQLSAQHSDGQKELEQLYDRFKDVQLSKDHLIDCLRCLVQKFNHVYIILDAIDEIPSQFGREQMLTTLNTLRKWSHSELHIMVTSRDEPEICDGLLVDSGEEIAMRNSGVERDIERYITAMLQTDPRLHRWHRHHTRIESAMSTRAQGV